MERSFFEWILFLLEKYWPYFLQGTIVTLETAIIGTVLGYLLGFLLGMVQAAPAPKNNNIISTAIYHGAKAICAVFIQLFRGTPMMVQAMVVYYGLKTAGSSITPFAAAILVILLNTGAYMAETVRGGVISIDKGQMEGAAALGMSYAQSMFSVVIPQALRNVFPEMGNQFITNLKMTSVLNVIGISELYFATKTAANTYYKYFEAYLITGVIYFVLCFIFSKLFLYIEKKLEGKKDYELATEYMDAKPEQ